MFKATKNKGFTMKFENGYTISVQFGEGNYCSTINEDNEFTTSISAEVAIYDKDKMLDVFPSYGGNNTEVEGYLDSNEVAQLIEIVSKSDTSKEIETNIANMRYHKHDKMFPGPINL